MTKGVNMTITLKPCPLCGCGNFDIFDDSDSPANAIYCISCPYGVEDDTKTIEELVSIHNSRVNLEE